MKNNKMKLAAFVLAILLLTGCGGNASSNVSIDSAQTEQSAQSAEEQAPAQETESERMEMRSAKGTVEVPAGWVVRDTSVGKTLIPKAHKSDMNVFIADGGVSKSAFDGAALETMPELLAEIITSDVNLALDCTADTLELSSTEKKTINGIDFLQADGTVIGSSDTFRVRVYFFSLDGKDKDMISYPGYVMFAGKQEGDRALSQEELNGYLDDMEQVMETFISTEN